ncbi:MAG: hypothetical protein C4297_09650 [Gemmataceae bacterium]
MKKQAPRVVITGVGVVSPLGIGRQAYWDALMANKSGVRAISLFDASGLPIRIGGEITDFDAREYVDKKDRKSLKVMSRPIQMAVAAAALALKDAHLDPAHVDPTRFGVEFGAGLIASELDELGEAAAHSYDPERRRIDMTRWGEVGLSHMPPLWMLKYLPNMSACHISILFNAQGPNNTITESDVAPLLALGEAWHILRRGHADVMLVGGTDSKINPLSLTRWSLFAQLTERNDIPEEACKPFDRHRDGIVPGEGAGVVVLETWDHARRRGAPIIAEMIGFGAACDAHLTGEGLARAVRAAMAQAGVAAHDLDHINAQGFATREDDIWEARGYCLAFGGIAQVPRVTALKGYFGCLGSGGAVVELIASLLALLHGKVPATRNYATPDPECPLPVIAGAPQDLVRPTFVKTACTDMGQCAAAVIRRWETDGAL